VVGDHASGENRRTGPCAGSIRQRSTGTITRDVGMGTAEDRKLISELEKLVKPSIPLLSASSPAASRWRTSWLFGRRLVDVAVLIRQRLEETTAVERGCHEPGWSSAKYCWRRIGVRRHERSKLQQHFHTA
jgi:hypothetical protein